MGVMVYSIPNCTKCAAAKALLKRKGIPFEEFDVQSNHEKVHEVAEKIGHAEGEIGMPVLDIGGTIVQGFDKEKILAALKEKGLAE